MSWHIGVYQALVQSALAGVLLTGVAAAAISFVKQPARKIRLIEFTLFGLCILPLAALVPGLPRWSVLPALAHTEVPEEAAEQSVVIHTEPLPGLQRSAEMTRTRELTQPVVGPRVQETIVNSQPGVQPEWADAGSVAESSPSESVEEPVTAPAVAASPPALLTRSENDAALASGWDIRAWLVAAYLAGVAAMIGWSAVGWLAVARLLRSALPADERCQKILREIGGAGTERVRLVVSPRTKQPCAVAWRPTTIILPSELCASPDSQSLRWALAHEWSHVERGDVWTWAAGGLVRWFYFYQPLLWRLRRQLRLCQDFVADDRAARVGSAHEDYAEFLTSYLTQADRRQLVAGLGIGGHASELERRIVMLVENHPPLESSSPRRWNLLVLPIAVMLIAAAASLGERRSTIGAEPPAEESQAKESAGAEPQSEPVVAPAPKATPAPAAAKPQLIAPAKAPHSETPKPVPSPAAKPQIAGTAPVAGTVAPRKPRTIAPGDVLTIEIITNYPDYLLLPPQTSATVEDDGKVPLGSKYGSPILAGKALDDAARQLEEHISDRIRLSAGGELNDKHERKPLAINVRISYANAVARPTGYGVTYTPPRTGTIQTVPGPTVYAPQEYSQPYSVGPSDDEKTPRVQSPSKPDVANRTKQTGKEELIQPLDTIQVLLSLNPNRVIDGTYSGSDHNSQLQVSGTYPIEPDGNISLPHGYGRVNLKGLNQKQAGAVVRKHLSGRIPILTALPTVRVVRRGRAVWPNGKEPGPDYRVSAGDKLLIGMDTAPEPFEFTVNPEGKLGLSFGPEKTETTVAGLTLAEAQEALQKIAVREGSAGGGIANITIKYSVPIFVTIGGWREEADPEVVEQFEVTDASRVQRLESDIRDLKDMVRKLKGARN